MKRNWNQFIHPGLSASQQIIILGDAPGASQTPPTPILVDEGGGMISWSYAGPTPAAWGVYIAPVGGVHDLQIDAIGSMTSLDVSFLIGQTIQIIGLDLGEDAFTTPPSNAVLVSSGIEPFWTPPEFDLETVLGFTLGVTDLTTFPFVDNGNLAGLTAIAFPMSSMDSVNFFSEPDMTSLTGTSITTCAGSFSLNEMFSLQTVSFPALTSIGGSVNIEGSTVSAVDFSSLQSVGDGFIMSALSLSELSLPALLNIPGDFNYHDDTVVTEISFPACTSLGTVTTVSDSNLVTLNLPSLTSLTGGTFNCGACSSLTTVNIGSVVIADGGTIDFSSGSLNVASINAILRRCAVSGLTSSDIELAGGTNASPTGQGLLDVATLQAAGCNVNTN